MATQNKKQTQLIIGLIVVAAVLVAAIVIFATRSTGTTGQTTASTATSPTADMTGKTNAGTGATADTTPFDMESATRVPAGQTPAQFVEGYYKAVVAGDFAAAYQFLPQAKKQGQSQADFATQLKGYGITSFKMGATNTSGTTMTIEADEVAGSYGTFTTVWTFVQHNGAWLLKSKAVAGMR
ncbi:MAG: hypothetical protein FWC48_04395 [Actinomycetia bacterium]|nr:hypothetical protein [Actinomycetes bacterium]